MDGGTESRSTFALRLFFRSLPTIKNASVDHSASAKSGMFLHSLWYLLSQHDERLSFFDYIRGELRRRAAADVLRRVVRSGRDKQDAAGLERHRRFALDLILERPFEDINDLFARMRVFGSHRSRGELVRTPG